jgi:hypothetical protein
MTIAQLIKHLEQFPQDCRVVLHSENGTELGNIFFSGKVEEDEDFIVLEQVTR